MTNLPLPPANIGWSTVSLAKLPDTNGHVEVHYSTATQTWGQPRLVKDPFIKVHGLSPSLNYGQQCYEGMKGFRTAGRDAVHIFRPHEHAARIRQSARMLMLPEVPEALFLDSVRLAVVGNSEFVPPANVGNGAGFIYLRPVILGVSPSLALQLSEDIILAIYIAPVCSPLHGNGAVEAVVIDEFDRSATRAVGYGQVGDNYAPVWPYAAKAYNEGYGLTLHLDSETRSLIEEFSTSGFIGFVTRDGQRKLYQSETSNAIHSITSDSLVAVAEQQGWEVYHEPIPFSELHRFDQVFAVGTGATAVAVRSITRPSTSEKFTFDVRGPGQELVSLLISAQRGAQVVNLAWCWNVTN